MRVYELDGTWAFTPAGAHEAVPIEVPGFWEAQGHLLLDGAVTYERDVDVVDDVRYATLEFDAVADICNVSLNGVAVGSHEVGFTPFVMDVSGVVRAGRNVVRVEVDDPAPDTASLWQSVNGKQGWADKIFPSPPSLYLTYGGIWQPCRLVVHGPVYIDDLWCDLDPHEPWVGATLTNRGGDDVDVTLVLQGFGQRVGLAVSLEAGASVETGTNLSGVDAASWSPQSPALHVVTAQVLSAGVASHERSLTTGLRRLERDGDDLLLDGRLLRPRSALHQGFWPTGLYAADRDLVDRDLRLAREAGLTMLRTHLKAFEPAWLDAADRTGMLLHCDTPIGEPIDHRLIRSDTDFVRRCVTAVAEQVRRDRSRPSIVMWTLVNEWGVGMSAADLEDIREGRVSVDQAVQRWHDEGGGLGLLTSPGYRDVIRLLAQTLGGLDRTRPFVENDFVEVASKLVVSDIRTPHWYGRATAEFADDLDTRLEGLSSDDGPVYVNEFGTWGLPTDEGGEAFWDNQTTLDALIADAGWRPPTDDFCRGTQAHQGWANRLHAEHVRTSPLVRGFCVTEWTDVPYELNGLVSLRRTPKQLAIESFRPAVADVAPIAILRRFAYAEGETVDVAVHISNWSSTSLPSGVVTVALSGGEVLLDMPPVPAGAVAALGTCRLVASRTGITPLTLTLGDTAVAYDLLVVPPSPAMRVDVVGSAELRTALGRAGWTPDSGPLLIAGDAARSDTATSPAVLLGARAAEPTFGPAATAGSGWGPTPFTWSDGSLPSLPGPAVLGPEIFHCAPDAYLPGARGLVGLVVPPPVTDFGGVVVMADASAPKTVACLLDLERGLLGGNGFDLAVLADLVRHVAS